MTILKGAVDESIDTAVNSVNKLCNYQRLVRVTPVVHARATDDGFAVIN